MNATLLNVDETFDMVYRKGSDVFCIENTTSTLNVLKTSLQQLSTAYNVAMCEYGLKMTRNFQSKTSSSKGEKGT